MPTDQHTSSPPIYKTLAHLARRCPPNRDDRPVHVATLTRWIISGVRGADGSRIRLRGVRFPGGWRSTDEWLDAFLSELTATHEGRPEPPAVRTPVRRRREFAKATAEADRLGL